MIYRMLVVLLFLFGLAATAQADPPGGRGGPDSRGHTEKYEKNKEREKHARERERERDKHVRERERERDKHVRERERERDKHAREHAKRKYHDRFIDDDRHVVVNFYKQNPSSLPPGLAKRGGNLPPGLAKRGGRLPPGLARGQVVTPDYHQHMLPLPRDLERLLPPPPHEVIRRIVGRDLVLIHKTNMKVLDVLKDALP